MLGVSTCWRYESVLGTLDTSCTSKNIQHLSRFSADELPFPLGVLFIFHNLGRDPRSARLFGVVNTGEGGIEMNGGNTANKRRWHLS